MSTNITTVGELMRRAGYYTAYKQDVPFVAGAVKWLRDRGADLNATNQPRFLAVNTINPHDIMYFNTEFARGERTGGAVGASHFAQTALFCV